MKEVTYPTAKLAKQKGIEIISRNFYGRCFPDSNFDNLFTMNLMNFGGDFSCYAPAQAEMQDVLRNKYGIEAFVTPYIGNENKMRYMGYILIIDKHVSGGKYLWATVFSYETFEEALEPSLLEALNRI